VPQTLSAQSSSLLSGSICCFTVSYLLAPIYGWFTEGFDTPDLNKAKALLEALDASPTTLLAHTAFGKAKRFRKFPRSPTIQHSQRSARTLNSAPSWRGKLGNNDMTAIEMWIALQTGGL
jgi:hypothetical protein